MGVDKLGTILVWIFLGLIAGFLAKLIMPGDDPGGLIITVVIGVVGGLIGGLIGRLLNIGDVTGINVVSVILAVVGAVILLAGYRMYKKRAA